MRSLSPNLAISTIRALLPALPEVRRFAASLARPLHPVVAEYLASHCVGWDWPVARWFERIDLDTIDPHVDVTMEPGEVIEVLDWSAVRVRWRPCGATGVQLLEPVRTPVLDALAAIDAVTFGQLGCDLRSAGLLGADLHALVVAHRATSPASQAQARALASWCAKVHRR